MSTHSFYIPAAEDGELMRALQRLASVKRKSVSEIITEFLKQRLNPVKGAARSGGWASAFLGKWAGRDAGSVARTITRTRSRHKPSPLA